MKWEAKRLVPQRTSWRYSKNEQKLAIPFIEAKRLKAMCKKHSFEPYNLTAGNMNVFEACRFESVYFDGEGKPFAMRNVVCMDLEACSFMNSGSLFMVDAIG